MAHCFTPIRGRRMRVTKVNALGRPVYGPASFVTTSGFVSVQFSPEIEEGEETTVKTASGELCVSEKACDELKWISVQMEFCQVDPCLFTLINETWTELRDCVGDVIGWAESHKFSCDSGFGLELWTDVTGYTPTTPGAAGAWGYMLLPFIVGGTLGEQTVENGAVSFQITGRTKKGSSWGVGPYDVMCNDPVTGACGPLLTPVGSEEPRRIFLTTCAPPVAKCGCQPLSSPDGPTVTVVEDTTVPSRMGVTALVPAGTLGAYKVSWGDSAPVEDITAGTPAEHIYDRPGDYNVSVWDATNTQRITVVSVVAPFTGAVVPVFTATEEPGDPAHKTVRATVTNAAAGHSYQVQWEAGAGFVDLPTTGTPNSAAYQYATADGDKVITVRDKAEPSKSSQKTVTIPFPQPVVPNLLLTEDGTATPRRQVRVTVTNPVAGRFYEASFEGGTWEDVPATGAWANSLSHTYTSDGAKTVQVRDKDSTATSAQLNTTLPFTGPTFSFTQAAGTPMNVAVTVANPGAGVTYEVQWDAAGAWTDLAGAPPTGSHTYVTGGTYPVTVRDKATPATTATKQVRVPYVAGFGAFATTQDSAETAVEPPVPATTTRKRTK